MPKHDDEYQAWWDARAQHMLCGACILLFCVAVVGKYLLADGLFPFIADINLVLSIVCGLVYLVPELIFSSRHFGIDSRSFAVLVVFGALLAQRLTAAATVIVLVLGLSLVLSALTQPIYSGIEHKLFEIPASHASFVLRHVLALLCMALLLAVAGPYMAEDIAWNVRALSLASAAFPYGMLAVIHVATQAIRARDKATGVPNTGWESVKRDSYAYGRVRMLCVFSCGAKALTCVLVALGIIGISIAALIEAGVVFVAVWQTMRLTKGMPTAAKATSKKGK